MSCHITSSPNRRAKHITPFHSRADIAHLGANGYEFDATKVSEEDFAQITGQVKAYHADESLVLEGDLYRMLRPGDGSNYFAECLVAKDKTRGKLVVMKLQQNFNEPERRVYPCGLAEDKRYRVAELDAVMLGSSWMRFGIMPKFPEGDYETLVYHFDAIDR